MPRRARTIQRHHIKYKDKDGVDVTVLVFKGEHFILTKMQQYCRKNVSAGFIFALKTFIKENEFKAQQLPKIR